ncbi:hypothetical protein ACFP81_04260 [Deinococcus lacus]|uniref:DUF1795 domain-containing protein n=1 Tax=Deinococcus lacus TaxID=392561 RepID=A0ABW1YAS0_9DEIO
MKRALTLTLFALGAASAAPANVGSLPVTVEPGTQLRVLSAAGLAQAFPNAAARPAALYMTPDRKVSVSFQWRQSSLAPNEVKLLLTQYPAAIRKQVPNVTRLSPDLVKIGGQQWAQFIFTTPGQGGERRHELLMTSLQNRPLVITVDSSVADYSANEAAVRNLVNSVRFK